MSFLHGVLDNIKPKLGLHSSKINNAIESLKLHKHSGKEGFNAAIKAVVKGVREYNEGVVKSNNAVKKIVTDLQDYTKKPEQGGKLLKDINDIQVDEAKKDKGPENVCKQVDAKLEECKKEAQKFTDSLNISDTNNTHKDAINDLNDSLKVKLNNLRSTIVYENKRLGEVKEHEAQVLQATIAKVEQALRTLKTSVDCNIRDRVTVLVADLRKRVQKLLDALIKANQSLKQYVKELAEWINNANDAVNKALQQVEEIIKNVDWNDKKKYPHLIEEVVKQVEIQVTGLYNNGTGAIEAVKDTVKTALEAVKTMDAQLKRDLHGVREAIKGKVDAINVKIGELYGVVNEGDATRVTEKTIDALIKYVKGKIKGITGDGKNGDGILGFVRGLRWTYATGFEVRFQGAIKDMVQKIFQSDGTVSTCLNYVTGADKKSLQQIIEEKINGRVTGVSSKPEGKDNAEDTLNSIKNYVHAVVQAVDPESKATEISGEIESKVLNGRFVSSGDKRFLRLCLTTILTSVHSAVKGAEQEFEKFVQQSDISSLKTASTDAEGFDNNLAQALGGTNHAKAVDLAIKAVGQTLDEQLPEVSSSVNINGSSGFLQYKNQVDQSTLNGDINSLAGTLPAAIKEIKTQVNAALTGIDNFSGQAILKLGEVTSNLNNMCYNIRNAAESDPNSAKTKLQELKNLINKDTVDIKGKKQKGLNKIHSDLNKLQKELETGPLKEAQRFIGHADFSLQATLQELEKDVGKQVTVAQETLTTHARKQYVESIKALLTKFAEKVQSDLDRLPQAISDDLQQGHKKFMSTFAESLVKKVKQIGDIDTTSPTKERHPLGKAGDMLKPIFKEFFKTLEKQKDFTPAAAEIRNSKNALAKLVGGLGGSKHFDHTFSQNLESLRNAVTAFKPSTYGDSKCPLLLNALKNGFSDFVEQLKNAYVSTYSQQEIDWNDEHNPEKGMCAKIMLTVTPIVCDALKELKDGVENDWKEYKIYNPDASHQSLHRLYFRENGYDVGLRGNADSGELNHHVDCTGGRILGHLNNDTHKLFVTSKQSHKAMPSVPDAIPVDEVKEGGLIPDLFAYLKDFFHVGHLATSFSKRAPCSVYEQLVWLTGLPHNPVYVKLPKHVRSLFEVPDKNNPSEKIYKPIDASPSKITDTLTIEAIDEICGKAYAVLTTVVGTGDAECGYACEFPSNSLGLQYPSNPAQCFDTLLDVLRRLFPPLKFLFAQCGTPAAEHGWLRCEYGRDVKSTKSQCNEHTKQGTKEPTKCLPKSPLQSYLSDSLIGHLPHNLTSIGCQAKCTTCPGGKPGMPCITPLGFRGFSGSTKTGAYLSSVIGELLEIRNIYCLFALSVKTPRTLPEHFEFASALVRGWHDGKTYHKVYFQKSFEDSASKLSINLYEQPAKLTDALRDVYGSESVSHSSCEHHHLMHLTSFGVCNKTKQCAPYLSSLCGGYYTCLPFKNSSTYLSWAIYLPWTFWDLLNNLYNAFCQITCADWGCRGCLRGDKCKRGKHGVVEDDKQDDDTCQCESIVSCRGVAPTLYQYGFSFGEASTLNSGSTVKKCKDFCSQLHKVLHSDYFDKLFKECDEFLKQIRFPFMTLLLALWSLSLLYLLHITVVRLDVLRIRSHLRSPSSHRIAAQSLLAASRVKALANVKQTTLNELKEKLKDFIGDENCKNLLTNLTEGLEKFLGYNEHSKGYDGTGIVYSDLDRLCDGVMAFILQCLQGSKTLLHHYYPQIIDTIRDLESKIGKGLGVQGFRDAIGRVRQGLERYEEKLGDKCKKVVEDVTAIQSNFTILREYLDNVNTENLQVQLQEVQKYARLYWVKASLAEEASKALDPALSGMLDKHVNLVVQAADGFKRSAEDQGVNAAAEAVDRELKTKKRNIDAAIEQGIADVQGTLNSGFEGIKQKLENLYQKKDEQFTSVNKEIEEAKALVSELLGENDKNFNEKYTVVVCEKFEHLKEKAAALKVDPSPGTQCQLEKDLEEVKAAVEEIEGVYQGKLIEVKAAVDLMVDSAVGHLEDVDTAVKKGLQHVRTQINIQLDGFLKQMWIAVELGVQMAATSDTYSPTKGVTGLETGFQTAKLNDLETRFRVVAHDNPELAKKINSVLKNLNAVKTDKSATLSGDVLFEQLGRDIKTALENQLKDVIKEELGAIKLDELMSAYYKETMEDASGQGALRGLIEDIKEQFGDGISSNGRGGGTVNTDEIDGYKYVEAGDEDSGDGARPKYDWAIKHVLDNINNLESLPGAIEDARKATEKIMEVLKNEIKGIQTRIDKVEEVVQTAEYQLTEDINNISMAYNDAEQKSRHTINQLNNQLTNVVREAFSTLTHQVRSLFAKQKQAELTQLQGVVTAQLARIDEIIREDKATGVKGFFKEMNSLLEDQFQRSSLSDGMKLSELAVKAVVYFEGLFEYLDEEFTPRRPKAPRQGPGTQNHDPHAAMVENIRTALNALLAHLCKTTGKAYNFDYTFSKNLDALLKSVADLSAEKFGEGKHADLLNLLKDGVNDFGRQLEDAYVNRYAERVWSENDSTKYAKVCLTTFPMLLTGLKELKENIEKSGNSWRRYAIYNSRQPQSSLYGVFLRDNGYDVGRDEYIQRGELNYKTGFNGGNILQHLTSANHVLFSPSANSLSGLTGSTGDDDDADLPIEVVNEEGILPQLHSYLKPYAETCHLSTFSSKKSPCSIYEMLLWLTGLQFNSVYESLIDHIHSLFLVDDDSQPPQKILKPIDAYPKSFLPNDVNYALDHICSHSYAVLTALIGTGDAYTNYACDFSCNHIGLHYPTSGENCLSTLLDILRRLFPTLRFINSQCRLTTQHGGWEQCLYGKDASMAKSPCSDHSNSQPNFQPNGQANAEPNCQPMCRPTSPLMSYLNDCLPGHLPHQLSSVGCRSVCQTCPGSKPGMPCLTPLGFRAFSGSTKTGKELCDVLTKFFDDVFVTALLCLAPKPPATLSEHFGFVESLVRHWHYDLTFNHKPVNKPTSQVSVESSIKKVSINLYGDATNLTKTFIDAYGSTSASHVLCKHPHLSNITKSEPCYRLKRHCAPYLTTLCHDFYSYIGNKNSNLYLSWAVYTPWKFWEYLNNLLQAFNGILCKDWGCRKCLNNANCKNGEHGKTTISCQCSSLVKCKGVSPTLYKYGFIFGDAASLNSLDSRKSCFRFAEQLGKIIHSQYFKNLFEECDKFLYIIRSPFMNTLLALWSLSLLYLLHIAVVRLDVLRIRSHLRSPASHRIAAQSLLAAARVRALANVKYFSP
ncbi:hypothetical protein, conserved [Babesia ovata]|uniref:C3H1-type domain-containing protein n=1 Tax=Babesia ovata TaxID=189622 RepID=A0A2H6KK35_9APIC|nr:uncharacterized protein BOVATA_048470 [Babesia ovata]GBE63354.1 hypothetical protein, conserved [Babesia ovata]